MTTIRIHQVLFAALTIAAAAHVDAQSKTKTRIAHASTPQSAPPLVAVYLSPIDSAAGDSIRTIVAHDLELGDRVRLALADTGRHRPPTLRGTMSATGIAFALLDSSGAVKQQRDFPLPRVPAARDSAIADSVTRALAARDTVRFAEIARLSYTRDSLARESAKPKPKLKKKEDQRAYAVRAAARDTILRDLATRDSALRAESARDLVSRDSAYRALIARDAFVRDSVAGARRWATHDIADALEEWLTGVRGISATRIAYVSRGAIHVIDFDGTHDHVVTSGPPALSPSWRPDGGALAYMDMTDAGTAVAWVDLATGTTHPIVATKRGLNTTPVFTRDGHRIIFTTADPSRPALVSVSADSGAEFVRVGGAKAWEADEPALNPDGTRIAYVSPRPSVPQIYSSNLDGTDERLELPKPKFYSTAPEWSPDGRYIAFEQQNHLFQVWLLDRNTHRTRRLTSTGENEDPTWAPDARHLAITSDRNGSRAIWILDLPTGHTRLLTSGNGDRLPAWSPRIPPR